MKKLNKIKCGKILAVVLIGLLVIASLLLFDFTKSVLFDPEESVEVQQNTELVYYLDVSYEGVDRYANDSTIITNTSTTINTESGYIFVEDKLPEGLTFIGFVESPSEDGSIGAVSKLDSNKACLGSVYDDMEEGDDPLVNYHGLHYNADTRTISFRVKYLQAGCKLTVGIKTMTPETIDDPETKDIIEERRDFFNTATAREGSQLAISNTVHAWMGKTEAILYNVSYKYEGEVPTNAPDPSKFNGCYAENTTIGIASEPNIEGYKFSGWTLVQVEGETPIIQTGSKFVMPARDVELVGHFEKIDPYKVIYKIADGSPIPTGYELPSAKEYYPYQIVQIDSTKAGDKFDGYKFSGWTLETEGIEVSKDNDFVMPEGNVVIVGSFEKIKYKVEYKFTGTTLPENPEQYLPETKWYEPNQEVDLIPVDDSYTWGYKFMGWYKENKFVMPEEDVIIYGEWRKFYGYFHPKITKDIINKQDYYKKGDIVKYKIVVSNPVDMNVGNLINVTVKEFNEKARFIDGEGYILKTDHLILIPVVEYSKPVTIYAEYEVTDEVGTIENIVQIISGSSTSGAELDTMKEYKAKASFDIWPELKISKKVSNSNDANDYFQFHITSKNGYDTWINLRNNENQVLYLEPSDTYYIKEIIPQEYILKSVTGDIKFNGGNIEVELGDKLSVEFTNEYQKKSYYHSNGRVSNEVQNCETGDCKNLWSIIKNSNESKTTTMDGTSKTSKIYYYDTEDNNNNVLFADKCWRVVRTTDTNGVKLMYSGEPVEESESSPISKDKYINIVNDESYEYMYDELTNKWTSTLHDDSKSSSMELSVREKGNYVINYTISSEITYDKATFYKDGKQVGDTLSGSKNGKINLGIIDSSTIIKVTYSKDYSTSSGSDNVIFSIEEKRGTLIQSCTKSSGIFYNSDSSGLNPFNINLIFDDGYMYNSTNSSKYKYGSANRYSNNMYVYKEVYLKWSSYVFGSSVSYDDSSGKYTLEGEVSNYSWNDNWGNLTGYYTCLSDSTICDDVYYVEFVAGDYLYSIKLSNNEDINKKIILAEYFEIVSDKYVLKNSKTISYRDYYNNYSEYHNYYLCSDLISTSCDRIYKIDKTYSKNYYFRYSSKEIVSFSNSVKWDGDKYILQDSIKIADMDLDEEKIKTYRYTCLNLEGTCDNIKYIYKYDDYNDIIYYIEITNGDLIQDVLNNSLGTGDDIGTGIKYKNEEINSDYVNLDDSDVKSVVDDWYKENLIDFTDYIEDTIYCNDRTIYNYGGFDPNNKNYSSLVYGINGIDNLTCPRKIDSFTVSEKNGNGDLTYPIGLLTLQETKLINYNETEYVSRCYYNAYTNMTPLNYNRENYGIAAGSFINDDSYIKPYGDCEDTYNYGVHPVISLKANTMVCVGDGSKTNPYRIETREGE